jgi:hypothetical protein
VVLPVTVVMAALLVTAARVASAVPLLVAAPQVPTVTVVTVVMVVRPEPPAMAPTVLLVMSRL